MNDNDTIHNPNFRLITLIHSGCWQIPKPRNFERTKVPYPKNHKSLKIVCRTFGGGIKMYFFGLEVYNF